MDKNIYQREGAYLIAVCTALDQVNIFWQYTAVLFFDDGSGSVDDDDIVVRCFLFRTSIDLSSNFSVYRKGVYSVGIKLFNSSPECIKNVCGIPILFKSALNNYLYSHYYSVDEYVIVSRVMNHAYPIILYQLLLYVQYVIFS